MRESLPNHHEDHIAGKGDNSLQHYDLVHKFNPMPQAMKKPAVAVSDLCDEYRICQTRTERPVLAEQSEPLFEPARLLMTTPTPSIEVPAQENLLQKYKERVERLSQQNRVIKNLYWCRIPDKSWSRTVLHDKGHWRVLTIYRSSGMSWVHFAKRWKIIWPERLDSREHQNWARIGSHNQLLAR